MQRCLRTEHKRQTLSDIEKADMTFGLLNGGGAAELFEQRFQLFRRDSPPVVRNLKRETAIGMNNRLEKNLKSLFSAGKSVLKRVLNKGLQKHGKNAVIPRLFVRGNSKRALIRGSDIHDGKII